MQPIDRSVLQQKAHKTFDRNEYIRFLYQTESNMAELGRRFNLSRQAISKIVYDKRSKKNQATQ